MAQCKILLAYVFVLVFKDALSIIESGSDQKPAYTPGIKTTSWRSPHQIQVHHNYSRVVTNANYIRQNVGQQQENTQTNQNIHPVYNGHSYGGFAIREEKQLVSENTHNNHSAIYKVKKEINHPIEVYSKCPKQVTGQFVHQSSCNQFLNCWKGRGYVQTCPAGTLFNPKTLECDYADKVECITGPERLVEYSPQRNVKQATCPSDFTGLIPDYTDCTKFINCNSGFANRMDCPPGTLFDIKKSVCDHPYAATCFNGQNLNTGQGGTNFNGQSHGQGYYGQSQHSSISGQYNREHLQGQSSANQYSTYGRGQYGQNQNFQQSGQYNQGQTQDAHGHFLSLDEISAAQANAYANKGFEGGYGQHFGRGQHGTVNTNQLTDYSQNQGSSHTSFNQGGSQYQGGNYGTHTQDSTNTNSGQFSKSSNFSSQISQTTRLHPVQGSNSAIPTNSANANRIKGGTYSGQIAQSHSQINHNSNFGRGSYTQGSQVSNHANSYGSQNIYGTQNTPGIHQTNQGRQNILQHQINSQTDADNRQSFGGINVGNNYGKYNEHQGVFGTQTAASQSGGAYDGINSEWESSSSNRVTQGTLIGYGRSSERPLQVDQNTGSPKCPDGASGIYPHPFDCLKFLNCDNGRTFIQDCGPGTAFNAKLRVCDFINNVDCEYTSLPDEATEESVTQIIYVNKNTNGNYQGPATPNYKHVQDYTGSTQNVNQNINQNIDSKLDWEQQVDQKLDWGNGNIESRQFEGTNHVLTTQTPIRYVTPRYFESSTHFSQESINQFHSNDDYEDTFGTSHSEHVNTDHAQSLEDNWPPPFPSTDVNADYFFEYENGEEVTLEPENSKTDLGKDKNGCWKSDYHCSPEECIMKIKVCDGVRDCPNGRDESDCNEFLGKFNYYQNARLTVLEKERWDNVSASTCALLCLETIKFECKSYNYRKIDRTCFLTDQNIGMSGALISYYPIDYYELKSTIMDCSNKFKCTNKKCIEYSQVCDGLDDCGDRMDEKNCDAEKFGYYVKLAGSQNEHEGRIEVTAFGKTGYICDDSFGINSANVVCKELGFDLGAAEVKKNSFYEEEIMAARDVLYMMDDVFCVGNETSLKDCDFSGWGVHNCREEEAVGVVCKTPLETCPENFWECTTGKECIPLPFICDNVVDCADSSDEEEDLCDAGVQVRLVNGSNRNEGRLEIRKNGIWGTVCDDDFNEDAAKVVCKSLGYSGSSYVRKDAYFGKGKGPIWLDQVYCKGNESSLETCSHWEWGEHNCEHAEDVGIVCSNTYMPVVPKHVPNTNEDNRHEAPSYPEQCGYRKDNIFLNEDVHARVIKGNVAKSGDYPWQAAIKMKGNGDKTSHWCGAIIISERWILTAAHCLEGYPKGVYTVVAGDYDTTKDEGTEQHSFIEDFYLHEEFRHGHKMNNDIALIKLKGQGLRLNQDVQAICLPDEDLTYTKNLNCTISGFGTLRSGSSAYSRDLRSAWIPIQDDAVCKMPHVYGDHINENMFCAGFLEGGTDACDGDSGGPLACLEHGQFTLYGIISWGQHCGYANRPGVYVKVANYISWIDKKIKEYS